MNLWVFTVRYELIVYNSDGFYSSDCSYSYTEESGLQGVVTVYTGIGCRCTTVSEALDVSIFRKVTADGLPEWRQCHRHCGTCGNKPEDRHLHQCRCNNLKSRNIQSRFLFVRLDCLSRAVDWESRHNFSVHRDKRFAEGWRNNWWALCIVLRESVGTFIGNHGYRSVCRTLVYTGAVQKCL